MRIFHDSSNHLHTAQNNNSNNPFSLKCLEDIQNSEEIQIFYVQYLVGFQELNKVVWFSAV